ncbi:hypothetical protein [Methylobacterium nonmethylotrophicum]|uniref:hypothetical protein n=1 Tax=Methylobacterium nonmethylotrophicum TaxID=1141884 RepID=UPI0014366F1C|nr:hypothetical protein [Methylobacterium nonmethylotrophicum]
MPDLSDLSRRALALLDQFLDWPALRRIITAAIEDGIAALRQLSLHDALLIWVVLLLVVLCILVLRLASRLSRLAAKQAGATADLARAAAATADLQRATSARQLRAYVDVSSVTFQRFAPGQEIVVRAEVRNHGLTPALDLTARLELTVLPFPASELPNLQSSPADAMPSVLAARDGQVILQRLDLQASSGLAERLLAGEMGLHVVGLLTYADVFGEPHVTRLSLVASGERVRGRQPFARCEAGNELT